MSRYRILVGVILLGVLSGCTVQAYSVRPGEMPTAVVKVAPDQRAAMWQRAVVALVEQGYVPQVLNESAGYISARRRDDLEADTLAGTMVIVILTADGTLRVQLSGVGLYRSEKDFLSAVQERQNLITKAIVDNSPNG